MAEPFLIPKPRRTARRFRNLLILAFLGTFVIPGTREVHWMSARILVPARQGVVVVQGDPPGCTVFDIPNTAFRKGCTFEDLGLLPDSPDAVLLGMLDCDTLADAGFGLSGFAWPEHPGLVWTARRLAERRQSDSGHDLPPERRRQELDQLLGLIRMAQETHPDNGAVWLAEALVYFGCGTDAAALEALANAARRPEWDCGIDTMFPYATDRLQAYGYTRLDASIEAFDTHFDVLSLRLREHMNRIMAEDAADGNHAEVAAVMDLWGSLMCCNWVNPAHFNLFRIPAFDDELSCAMSDSHPDLAGVASSPSGLSWDVRVDMMKRYLQAAGFELAASSFSECATTTPHLDGLREPYAPDVMLWFRNCSLFGTLSCFLLAGLLSMALIGIPFRNLGQRDVFGNWRPAGFLFWGVLSLAVACSAYVLWNAIISILGSGAVVANAEGLTWRQKGFACGACSIAFGVILLNWLTAARPGVCRALLTAACMAYFALVVAGAYSRHFLTVLVENQVTG